MYFQTEQRTYLSDQGTQFCKPQSFPCTSAGFEDCLGFEFLFQEREFPSLRRFVWKGHQYSNWAEHVLSTAILNQQLVFLVLTDMSVLALSWELPKHTAFYLGLTREGNLTGKGNNKPVTFPSHAKASWQVAVSWGCARAPGKCHPASAIPFFLPPQTLFPLAAPRRV